MRCLFPLVPCLFAVLCLPGLLGAQIPVPGTGSVQISSTRRTGFVDFSESLGRAQVSVVVGTLGKFRDGKKKRVSDPEAHTGAIGSVVRMSGTQYFKAKTKTKLAVEHCETGKKLKGKVSLAFEVLLNRMSDGSMQRMVLGAERQPLKTGMRALFVLDRAAKSKGYHIVHVIPMKRGQKKADFAKDVSDFVAINLRLAELRRVYADVKAAPTADAKKTKVKIDAVLSGPEAELQKLSNEAVRVSVLRPWKARLKKLIKL